MGPSQTGRACHAAPLAGVFHTAPGNPRSVSANRPPAQKVFSGYPLRGTERDGHRPCSLSVTLQCKDQAQAHPTCSCSPCSLSTCWGSKCTAWPLGSSQQNKALALISGLPFRWGRRERPAAHRWVRSVDGMRQRRGWECWGRSRRESHVPGRGGLYLGPVWLEGLSLFPPQAPRVDGGWAGVGGAVGGALPGLGVTAAGPTAPGPAALRGERRDVLGPGPAGRTHRPPGLLAH